jgi:aspartyl-tRNA(Asn)/glutamyl-tRNA(Gln) amidotransferase subunit B
MTQYEPVIGLEIHAELQTNSKMFCGCSAVYSAASEPNTLICPICTGLPGAMPAINKKAVKQAILVGLALNCTINEMNTFARKNYFYPDLPKGYQVSQYDLPVASNGWLEILDDTGRESQRIRVRRAHLEEDTAKLSHQGNSALVDFNRAGVPLLEIVSEPDMRSVEAALSYATKIRAILQYLEVNSGDMEKGVLRFEANVSVRPQVSDEFRTRTEIKNLNSFRALTRASAYEIERQVKVYESGGEVLQETLGWDDVRGVTVSQRGKEDAHDYRYFPEPDLPPVEVSRAWVNEIKERLPELPDAKTRRFMEQHGLKQQDALLLISEKSLADYFEDVVSKSKSPAKTIHSWIAGEFMRYMNDTGLTLDGIALPAERFAGLIDMVTDKTVNGNSGKIVLNEMLKNGGDPQEIVKAKNLAQVSDTGFIQEAIEKILSDNPKEVEQFLAGKETILQWLMGQVARATKGKADPNVAKELLVKALEKHRK